jgi:hypothetical protein
VIISAPSADAPMFVMGVNHEKYSSDMKGKHRDLNHDFHPSIHWNLYTVCRGVTKLPQTFSPLEKRLWCGYLK